MVRQTSTEKTARYRERINADPVAKDTYIGRIKESCQRRKKNGTIKYIRSGDLLVREGKIRKDQWTAASKHYRERKKRKKVMLDFTPPPFEKTPPVLDGIGVDEQQESFEKCAELIPGNLEAVKDTIKIQQVVSLQPARMTHRGVRCPCKKSPCSCCRPGTVNLNTTIWQTEKPENPSSSPPKPPRQEETVQDLCGRFVIVTYDELPFVGQVLEVVEDELQISYMQQSDDKNLFLWPQTPDVTCCFRKDVHALISEPEPVTLQFSKLTCQDWVAFRNTCD